MFVCPATAFGLAAIAAAIVRSQQPYDHGWWLVAYLALVGTISQLALGAGQLTFAGGPAATPRASRVFGAEIVLWNLGATLVPVGVLVGTSAVVEAGSVILLTALVLFAAGTRVPRVPGVRIHRFWLYGYRGVVVCLSASVVVGTGLAGALPWQ